MNENPLTKEERRVKLERHMAQCGICRSPYREEIEERWTGWANTVKVAFDYRISRDCVYRHMHAFDLFRKRRGNIMHALEQIIERVDVTEMLGPQIFAAINMYMKLNSDKQEAEPEQGINFNELFERMSKDEREEFLQKGTVPAWFSQALGATTNEGQEGENGSQVPSEPTIQ